MSLNCPHCSHCNPSGALVCEQCYAALDTLLKCSNCGTLVPNQAIFCSQCGFPLSLNANLHADRPGDSDTRSGANLEPQLKFSAETAAHSELPLDPPPSTPPPLPQPPRHLWPL
ncbi:MAG: zinc ribbon domain-containing protein [Prochlorothrix sp.]|nr:zinc ribbon domain-containing protein [Prochlorothrix sp.]